MIFEIQEKIQQNKTRTKNWRCRNDCDANESQGQPEIVPPDILSHKKENISHLEKDKHYGQFTCWIKFNKLKKNKINLQKKTENIHRKITKILKIY